MNTSTTFKPYAFALPALLLSLALAAAGARAQTKPEAQPGAKPAAAVATTQTPVANTPSETVRAFYKALGERRFREAFAMSVFRPAVEGLTQQEFEELRPDFERTAAGVPAEIVLTGEQVSGDEATVFMKLGDGDKIKIEPVFLIRQKGAWIVGDRESVEVVKKQGKKYFFEQRIAVHHEEVEQMLNRIKIVQAVYAAQNNGRYGDLAALVRAGYVPQDILGTETTGYRFAVTPGKDGKSFRATAEPARYGQTGKLSFYADDKTAAVQKKDTGGKPLK